MKGFISYSRSSQNSVAHLDDVYNILKGLEITPVYDEKDPRPEHFAQSLTEAIKDCSFCVLIRTAESDQSVWCSAEIGAFWGSQKPVFVYEPVPVPAGNLLSPLQGFSSTDDPILLRKQIREQLGRLAPVEPSKSESNNAILETHRMVGLLLTQLKVEPFEPTNMFGARFGHFQEEKQAIARRVAELLDDALERYRESAVRIILDSGTTVYPLFYEIAKRWNRSTWKRAFIVTNNLPGMQVLMKHARDGADRHAPLSFRTRVTPGRLTPVYWAVLPEEEATQDDFFGTWDRGVTLGVTTSNYLSIDAKTFLARNRAHIRVKNWIMKGSDEVFHLFPLGKLLDANADELNNTLVDKKLHGNPKFENQMYRDVEVPYADGQRNVLVTTSRDPGDLLYDHYIAVAAAMRPLANPKDPKARLKLDRARFSIHDVAGRFPAEQQRHEIPHLESMGDEKARAALRRFLNITTREPPMRTSEEGTFQAGA